jgi:hypothetical protein
LRVALDEPVQVDVVRRVARAAAGTRWQAVVDATSPHGLTALHGSAPTVGVVGYAVGGGLSFYARSEGLMCNTVRSFDVVTADGRFLTIDADNESDLFWALRGGGGCFAVVTALEFDLLPIETVYAGAWYWPIERAREVLSTWTRLCVGMTPDMTMTWRLLRLPAIPSVPEPLRDTPVVCVNGVALGDAASAADLLAPLRDITPPIIDSWNVMSTRDVVRLHADPAEPLPYAADSALLGEFDDELIDLLIDAAGEAATDCPWTIVELRQLGGALTVGSQHAGAAALLPGSFLFCLITVTPTVTAFDAARRADEELLERMRPWTCDQTFMNYDERYSSGRQCFAPDVYDRLCRIRGRWDPDDVFVGTAAIDPLRDNSR